MGANIRLRIWADWIKHEANVGPQCRLCGRYGSVDPLLVEKWAQLHRWPQAAEACLSKFKCIKCGGRASRLTPTIAKPTVPNWGPSEREWKRMQNRLRQ